MREVEIVKIDVSTGKTQKMTDYVAEERPLFIFLNKIHYATILCSPSRLRELAVGHLLSTGVVKSTEEITEVDLKDSACRVRLKANVNLKDRLKLVGIGTRIISSACGGSGPYRYSGKLPKLKTSLTVVADVILNCVNRLNAIAEIFKKTGGVHVAAIFAGNGELVASAEDVGRHNAVDKAIGLASLIDCDFNACFLALSGRLTGDLVSKAARVGLPIVASLAAGTDSGIDVAKKADVTLVGFVRGKRMNVYSCIERIYVPK